MTVNLSKSTCATRTACRYTVTVDATEVGAIFTWDVIGPCADLARMVLDSLSEYECTGYPFTLAGHADPATVAPLHA
jgi:hypothetical protein